MTEETHETHQTSLSPGLHPDTPKYKAGVSSTGPCLAQYLIKHSILSPYCDSLSDTVSVSVTHITNIVVL